MELLSQHRSSPEPSTQEPELLALFGISKGPTITSIRPTGNSPGRTSKAPRESSITYGQVSAATVKRVRARPSNAEAVALNTEILDFFKAGNLVVDLFGGSGSTLIPCENDRPLLPHDGARSEVP
jgi:hypothetical protein